MPHLRTARISYLPALSGLAVVGIMVGAGWTLHAAARQNRPPAGATDSAKGALNAPDPQTNRSNPPSAKPVGKQKLVDIYLEDSKFDQKIGLMSGRNLKYTDTTENMTVTGETAQYDQNKDIVDAKGALVLDDPNHHVTGDKAHVERKIKLAVITGSVVIVLKPKEGSSADASAPDTSNPGQNSKVEINKDRNRGGTITCDQVDDYYKKEFAILKGHLVFKQQITKQNGDKVDRTLTADHAEYDGKANKMHLFSPVKFSDSDGQEINFEKDVFVGTKEGEESIESKGPSSGKILPPEDKDDTDNKQPEKKPAAPPKSQK